MAVEEEQIIKLPVKNASEKAMNYHVNIDLHGATGPANCYISYAGGTENYSLKICPTLGGIYAGIITFTDDEQRYLWFTFELECYGKKQTKQLEIASHVRKLNITEIELINPLDETIKYDVNIFGEGLNGPSEVELMPKQSIRYQVYFLPLRVFNSQGSMSFTNPRLGETYYEINLHGEEC